MFSARLITGVTLGLLALFAIFTFPQWAFGALIGFFILLAAWEWAGLMGVNLWGKIAYEVLMLIFFALSFHALVWTVYIGMAWWAIAFLLLTLNLKHSQWIRSTPILLVMGVLTLVPCWSGAMLLHGTDRLLLFYVFMLTSLSDTAAYYSGRQWGKHPLAVSLSPKKTVEGLIGGIVVASIAGIIIAYFIPQLHSLVKQLIMFVFGIFIILVGMLGDLFESLIKRQVNVKDSGSLLPGHGGVLDRVDSLCSAMPVFAAMSLSLGLLIY